MINTKFSITKSLLSLQSQNLLFSDWIFYRLTVRALTKAVLIFFLLIIAIGAKAQTYPTDLWHEGKILLVSEDTLEGLVKYNLERDLIQFQKDKKIQTFSSRKILFFEIYDASIEKWRQFYALPYRVKRNYKVPVLFEVLYQGKLSLLCRESVEQETVTQYGQYNQRNTSTSRKRLLYHYYFIDSRGEIYEYEVRKKDLLELMEPHDSEVKDFIKENKLKIDRRPDLLLITEFYNDMLKKDENEGE